MAWPKRICRKADAVPCQSELTLKYVALSLHSMAEFYLSITRATVPSPAAVLELLKPLTWFAPMWAFGCGVVSSNTDFGSRWPYVLGGVLLAGPLVCGASQAVNDWFDRHVDAINEPGRPIPSGRMPGRWGLYVALGSTALSVLVASLLGAWVFGAALLGLALAWAYSAPPFRLKRNGWAGAAAVGLAYEGLPWFTAAAAAAGAYPGHAVLLAAALYSIGAHGIMTLNDFKAVAGDRRTGLRSLPVILGVGRAARLACAVMILPQVAVAAWLAAGFPIQAGIVALLVGGQLACMPKLLRDPVAAAPWYNATGTTMFVFGMLATAFALRSM